MAIQEVIDIRPYARPISAIIPPSVVYPASPSLITTQPPPSPPMSTTFRGTRNAKCIETGLDGKRTWSTRIFDCTKEHTFDNCEPVSALFFGVTLTCAPITIGCLAFWCPCIAYGRNKSRLDHLSQRNRPNPTGRETVCNGNCFLYCCLAGVCGFGWAMQVSSAFFDRSIIDISESFKVQNRSVMRARYNVRGSGIDDCCSSFWCTSCVLAQESLELKLEENSFPRKVSRVIDDGLSRVIVA